MAVALPSRAVSRPGGRSADRHLALLRQLDRLLQQAVAHAREVFRDEQDGMFRGLFISEREVDGLIERQDRLSFGSSSALPDFLAAASIDGVSARLGLSEFDNGVLTLALAAELDLRYERLYAYLQDDVTKRRPTVDLALNLLCTDWDARLTQRGRFAPDAPLLRSGMLCLAAAEGGAEAPLLTRFLQLDERVVRALLGAGGLDPKLAAFCRLTTPPAVAFDPDDGAHTVRRLVRYATGAERPVRVLFSGPASAGKTDAAVGLAAGLGQQLLLADLGRCRDWRADPAATARTLLREAVLSHAVLYLDGIGPSIAHDPATTALLRALGSHDGIIIVAAELALPGEFTDGYEVMRVPFRAPDGDMQGSLWRRLTRKAGLAVGGDTLDMLANTFQLAPDQIDSAVKVACQRMDWQQATDNGFSQADAGRELLAAARSEAGGELAALTAKVKPTYRWADIVLPQDQLEQLQELLLRARFRRAVLERGGFGRKLAGGKGIAAMFAGPSGAGKTMAADVIAAELELDLFRVELSRVVSKYIGETEQNLERIFDAATRCNGVLLFDEADSIMGMRSQVHDAHDRYANLEISYLLQKMEQHEGITILTTNLKANIDDAFKRRLAFTIHFPLPDEAGRLAIWQRIWPAETVLATDVDFPALAARFRLSGGNICNIALSAAYLAAAAQRPVGMGDILRATRREYAKVGKALAPAELENLVR